MAETVDTKESEFKKNFETPDLLNWNIFKNATSENLFYTPVSKIIQHTKFGFEDIYIDVPNVSWGGIVEVNIPKHADLLNSIFVCISLPVMYVPGCIYARYAGPYLISKSEFIVDNVVISTIQDTFVGNALDFKKNSFEKMCTPPIYNPKRGEDAFDELFVKLDFWFCKEYYNSLPLVALESSSISIRLTLSQLSFITIPMINSDYEQFRDVKPLEMERSLEQFRNERKPNLKLVCKYIHLDNAERKKFKNPSSKLVYDVNYVISQRYQLQNIIDLPIISNAYVKEIFFTFWTQSLNGVIFTYDPFYKAYITDLKRKGKAYYVWSDGSIDQWIGTDGVRESGIGSWFWISNHADTSYFENTPRSTLYYFESSTLDIEGNYDIVTLRSIYDEVITFPNFRIFYSNDLVDVWDGSKWIPSVITETHTNGNKEWNVQTQNDNSELTNITESKIRRSFQVGDTVRYSIDNENYIINVRHTSQPTGALNNTTTYYDMSNEFSSYANIPYSEISLINIGSGNTPRNRHIVSNNVDQKAYENKIVVEEKTFIRNDNSTYSQLMYTKDITRNSNLIWIENDDARWYRVVNFDDANPIVPGSYYILDIDGSQPGSKIYLRDWSAYSISKIYIILNSLEPFDDDIQISITNNQSVIGPYPLKLLYMKDSIDSRSLRSVPYFKSPYRKKYAKTSGRNNGDVLFSDDKQLNMPQHYVDSMNLPYWNFPIENPNSISNYVYPSRINKSRNRTISSHIADVSAIDLPVFRMKFFLDETTNIPSGHILFNSQWKLNIISKNNINYSIEILFNLRDTLVISNNQLKFTQITI